MRKSLYTLVALMAAAVTAQAANVELKIATAAPGASSWVEAMRASAAEIKQKTEGRVTIKYYVGGVQGSDDQVLKKMRIRNLHGGAFTPSALSNIYPDINLYGLPLVFESYEEADYVRERMDQMLIDDLDKKGYVTFGFAATGFAFMMSSEPAATVSDLQGRKVWVPEGDEISYEAMQAISVSPTALPLTDVMVGLQTKLLDMVAVSATGALFLQWYTRVKYVTDLPLVYTYGFTAIDKKMFERISPADQKIVREVMTRAYAQFNEAGQEDNKEAMQAILGKGLQLVPVDPAEAARIRDKVAVANRELADKGAVTRDMYDLLLQYRDEFRNGPVSGSQLNTMYTRLLSLLARLDRYGRFTENLLLVALLAAMMLLAVTQIVLREVFNTGIVWAGELLELMVLWLAMIAAIAACRDDRHLRIDALSHVLPDTAIRVTRVVVDLFAAVVCAVVAWHAWRYLQLEIEFGDTVLIDTPAWVAHAVVPVSFAIVAYRFVVSAIKKAVGVDDEGEKRGRQAVIVGSVLLVLLAVLGAPLFAVIATSAMLGFSRDETDLMNMAIEIQGVADLPFLTAIPLFTFAGYILSESNAPHRLVRVTGAFMGWMPAGLAVVSLATCAFFTAFTGASGVTIIALGALLYPALKQDGYPEKFNLGLITAGGSLGLLFAPSLPLILYGVIAEVSIDHLFRAGILPGILMIAVLAGWSAWVNRGNRQMIKPFSWKELAGALAEAKWELPLPFVVLGGIYSGFLAVSDAAAITALYVFIVEVVILREIRWNELPRIIRSSMVLVGGILIILSVSLASTNYMISAGIPQMLLEFVAGMVSSQVTFLLLLLVFLLILGAILDIFSAIVLVVPLILPIAAGFDVHPVHLGIVFLAAMGLGYLTPPVGLNLFISSYRFEKPIMSVYSATFPFLIILMLSVILIAFWPDLSLWLVPD